MEGKKHKEMMQPYCDAEGVAYEDIISNARTSKLSAARKNIAIAMNSEGLSEKIIALRLNLAVPTIYSYLNPDTKEETVNDENNISENTPTEPENLDTEPKNQYPGKLKILIDFKKRPEVYESLLIRAEEELREPDQQALWFLVKIYEKTLGA